MFKGKLSGYFDASGKENDPQHKVLTVAGAIATPYQWIKFDQEWQYLLNEAGFPKKKNIPIFHMTDFNSGQGIFSEDNGWTRQRRNDFYQDLIEIITCYTLHRLGRSILLEDYRKFVSKNPASREFFGSAGAFAAMLCWEGSASFADKLNYQDSIYYVFEAGDEFRTEIDKIYAELSKDENAQKQLRFKEGRLEFKDKTITPLQAADVISWENFKDIKRLLTANPEEDYKARRSAKALHSVEKDFRCYCYEDLQEFWNDYISSQKFN